MRSWLVLVAVVAVVWGAGCDVGSGKLAGMGGATLATGAGGSGIRTGTGGRIATGSGGIATGSGGGIATGSGGDGSSNVCGILYPVAQLLPEVVIVLDTSASMNDGFDGPCAGGCGAQSKWAAAVSAIQSVVAAEPPEAQWGLLFFTPGGADVCASTPAGGAPTITVPVGNATATGIRSELSRRTTGGMLVDPGNRPTRAAIERATANLFGQLDRQRQGILLVTDGVPDCGKGASDPLASDLAGAEQAIRYASTGGLPTLVAGVAIAPAAEASLSEMALSGGFARTGSPSYTPVASTGDLAAAMSALIAALGPCTFAIPEPPSSYVSRGNIGVFSNDGSQLRRDPTHQNGWDYLDAAMTGFQLYGAACDAARSGQTVSITWFCLAV